MTTGPVVHVLDDDEAVRLAIASLLASVGLQARTHGSTHEFLSAERPDVEGCLVLDVRLPGASGLDLQAQLVERGVELPVILITGHGDIPMSVRGMKAGAVDFLPKPFREQDLLDAVARAIEIDRARRSERMGLDGLRARYAGLSPRERQVMALVAAGLLNKQVAGELGISEITVKIHRGAAMRKMGARTLPDLVRMQDALSAALSRPADDTFV
ncbi:response regulator transcription factor [Albimonas pacifica]|uniref:Two-component response regulator, FixJ family, consists of REC and HTH domains n=1 Tax=Albimonas pacifica TaxID=1114924 RepID=A0A1I3FRE4_9RHOB|nr:response regulator transcription factor [Albimonas pacifica]SFI13848.1 Two-component response regulator, FixJ family, consists of REC and HTH domains [Albimonas pacifica]